MQIKVLNMQRTEVENSYEHYRQKAESELIELRSKLESVNQNKESEEELHKQINDLKFELANKEYHARAALVEASLGEQALKEKIEALEDQVTVKTHLVGELQKQIDEIQIRLEQTGFQYFN